MQNNRAQQTLPKQKRDDMLANKLQAKHSHYFNLREKTTRIGIPTPPFPPPPLYTGSFGVHSGKTGRNTVLDITRLFYS